MIRVLALLAFLLAFSPPAWAEESAVWELATKSHNVEAWKDVEVLRFTFAHKSGKTRTHEWWVRKHMVRVTTDGKTVLIPVNARDLKGDEQIAAHKAFINDSFWLLFEFHVAWDKAKLEELGDHPSPFGGKARAFRITYPAQGGYTPGDAYIAFLGQDNKVMGWSYFPGGADKPKLTTLRGGYKQFGPLTLPTRFETPDGELFLEFKDVSAR